MSIAWRLVKASHAADAFTGEGARLAGGRWNQRGTALVYLGGSLALAALETFIHLTRHDRPRAFASLRVDVPGSISIRAITRAELPRNWREEPPPDSTKDIGSRWAEEQTEALLRVPSVIVPVEYNLLLNPRHPEAAKLSISAPESFSFDPRLWK